MSKIAKWLELLDLGKYSPTFEASEIDMEVLPELTEQDLRELDIPLGPRRKLLKAIAALAEPRPPERSAASARVERRSPDRMSSRGSHAERRQLTVMFCDLVGSTTLSELMDPEDLSRVVREYQECCNGVIARFGGHVARYLGDGILAYFGYPVSHENAEERALHAGLGIVEAVARLAPAAGRKLQVRIGVATGPVVVGESIGNEWFREQVVMGETPNLAARLQGLAEPDTVVVSDTTMRLAGQMFEYADLGELPIKGFSDPVRCWQIVREKPVENRFEAAHPTALPPMVGRDQDLELVIARWKQTRGGDGQVVLLSGEAGIGKSRMAYALRERLATESSAQLRYQCSPQHANSALYPIIEQMLRFTGIDHGDALETKLDKIEAMLHVSMTNISLAAPLIADLLSLQTDGRYPELSIDALQRKAQTQDLMLQQLVGLASERPVLVILEDAHWLDPTSRDLMDRVVDRVQDLPVLVLVTFRPDFVPPWTHHAHITSLALNRLGGRQATEVVQRVAGGRALPGEVLEQILARTDGVPLYIEELTRTILDSGLLKAMDDRYELEGALPLMAIPESLQDSLLARLDHLAPVKELAQTGAAIGREFSRDLLARVVRVPAEELDRSLRKLEAAGLLFRHGVAPNLSFSFKHALVQETAYQTLLKSRRQQIHARIVDVLEQDFPESVESQPELLAHHLTEAGMVERAVDAWYAAGTRASERSAVLEAVAHLERGLALEQHLPKSVDRDRKELDLESALGSALIAAKSWGHPETVAAFDRVRVLSERLGDHARTFHGLYGRMAYHYAGSAEIPIARELAEEYLRLAERDGGREYLMVGQRIVGTTLCAQGKLRRGCEKMESALKLYDPAEARTLIASYGQDPWVAAKSGGLAFSEWMLGYPDRARESAEAGIARARELGHAQTLFLALCYGGLVTNLMRRDLDRVRRYADEIDNLAHKHQVAIWISIATPFYGDWVDAVRGLNEITPGTFRERMEAFSDMKLNIVYSLGLIAELCLVRREPEEGLRIIDEAERELERTGMRRFEAEIHRLRGELLLLNSEPREAQRCFEQSLEVARAQEAKSWELRTALSRARLWQSQGKSAQARDLIAPIYGWFTEGFDTADLIEARALLETMVA